MYNPPRYASHDPGEALRLMEQNPFATVITVSEQKPFISHLPVAAKMLDGRIELMGHLARTNPHWRLFANNPTTIVFHGPHAYITPKWYAQNDVPTWNYLAVHAEGEVDLIEGREDLLDCLRGLATHLEERWPSGWELFIPEDLSGDQLQKGIVGFKMKVESFNFKKKLHQGSREENRAGVLRGLGTRTDDQSRALLEEMLKMYARDGKDLPRAGGALPIATA